MDTKKYRVLMFRKHTRYHKTSHFVDKFDVECENSFNSANDLAVIEKELRREYPALTGYMVVLNFNQEKKDE